MKEEKDIEQKVTEPKDAEPKEAQQKEPEKTEKAEKDAGKTEEKAGNEKPKHSSSVLGNKTIEDVIKREAKEEQDTSSPFSISKTLGGVIIARAVQKQIGLVLLVCAFLIIYISNRYVCQKKQVQIAVVEKKTKEARYKAIVCSSRLTEISRESNVMEKLRSYGDSTLTIPNEPPYLIKIEE